jgi:hypothetical protein
VYYVELYSRRPGVSPERLRETVKRTDRLWAEANPKDRPRLALGRTWGLGGPQYIVVWEIEGFGRVDEWGGQVRTDPGSAGLIEEWLTVVECDAGVYEEIGEEQLRDA